MRKYSGRKLQGVLVIGFDTYKKCPSSYLVDLRKYDLWYQ